MTEVPDRLARALADRYRIERELGEGGMATVYLARDLRHERDVALKVLRPQLAAIIGVQRFLSEVKTTANLQHPNILPLHDSGQVDGTAFYVMPFVEGESLRERLDRVKQLPIADAVRIAAEVAGALDYAHRKGIIHRDIKPDNILLHENRALVADFGIALAARRSDTGSRLTETGISVGTPHYMSPEQAMGERHLDGRTDVYALGCVLYEMLTGAPPFTGPTAQAIVARAMAAEPVPVEELRRTVPPHVSAALATALQKLPADRFDTAGAFGDALQHPGVAGSRRSPAGRATRTGRRDSETALLAVLGIMVLGFVLWGWLRPERSGTVERYPTMLGTHSRDGITFRMQVALSPDGEYVVFRDPPSGPGQLYIKRRDELVAQPLTGTEGATGPFFSPDGTRIGYFAAGQLRTIPRAGGTPLTLADSMSVTTYATGAWLEDGSIYYYDYPYLKRIPPAGGAPQIIASPANLGGALPWLPTPLPSGRGVLFTAHLLNCAGPISCRPSRVYVYDARRDSVRAVIDDAIGAWHVPTGHVLYLASSGKVMAVRWDNRALAPSGPPVPILDGVQAPGLVVAADGTALYVVGPPEFTPGPTPNSALVWVDRGGQVEPVDSSWNVNMGTQEQWGLALSPDGRRVALTLLTDLGADIWVERLPSDPVSRLTLFPGVDRAPAWTADGRAVTFISERPIPPDTSVRGSRPGIWQLAADGTGEPRLLWGRDRPNEAFVSRDGRWVVFAADSPDGSGGRDIRGARPGVDSVSRRLVATGYDEEGPALSPDSRWLAYVSNETGRDEVFVRPFPDVDGGKLQISSGGGSAPVWAHSGSELFYIQDGRMIAVPIRTRPRFAAGPPRTLFVLPERVREEPMRRGGTFAVSPDDQHFLMVRDNLWADPDNTTLVIAKNFLSELGDKAKK